MEATTELKCGVGVNEFDFGCWPTEHSSCEKIEKEAKVSINYRRQNFSAPLKKPAVGHINSYQRQVWSLPLYAARRSINGFF